MWSSRAGRAAALAGTIVSGAAFLAGCTKPVPDVMKVGVVTTLSGPYAPRGKDILDGAQLAADRVNASNYRIGGHPVRVEVVSYDDKGDVETAKKGAQELMDQGVHAVMGPILVPTTAAVVKAVAEKGTPHLFTTTTTALVGMGKGNTFRLLAHDELQGRAMAVFAYDTLQGARIGTITEAGEYGRGLEKTVAATMAQVNKKAVFAVEIDPKAEVSVDMARQIKEAKVDVIVLMAREPQLQSLLKTLKEVDHTDVAIVGSNAVRNKNSAKLPVTVRGLYATATAIDAEEFPAGKEFVAAFQDKFKAPPLWGAHYAYDGVLALTDAARRAGSVQAPELIAKLKSIDPMTAVNQQMRFNAQGEQLYASIAIYKSERGVWLSQMRSSTW